MFPNSVFFFYFIIYLLLWKKREEEMGVNDGKSETQDVSW